MPLRFVRADSIYVWDSNGKRYIDLLSMDFNVNVGHSQSTIMEAVDEQAKNISYVASWFSSEPQESLARELAALYPNPVKRSFFTPGGSESVEAAVKFARLFTKRRKLIALRTSYHGITYGASSVSGVEKHRPFDPALVDVIHTADPVCSHRPSDTSCPTCYLKPEEDLENAFSMNKDDIAAVFVEPIMGACYFVVPEDYLRLARELCDKYGALLIIDEIITGFGRTGKWFGIQHSSARPDILCLDKGLTSGYLPLGVTAVTEEVANQFIWEPISYDTTHGSHPLSCASALANLQLMKKKKYVQNAAEIGKKLYDELNIIASGNKVIKDLRGRGLLIAIELGGDSQDPRDLENLWKIGVRARELGLLTQILPLRYGFTLAVSPPLCITSQQVDTVTDLIERLIAEYQAMMSKTHGATEA